MLLETCSTPVVIDGYEPGLADGGGKDRWKGERGREDGYGGPDEDKYKNV